MQDETKREEAEAILTIIKEYFDKAADKAGAMYDAYTRAKSD
jgi:hypothetical protein